MLVAMQAWFPLWGLQPDSSLVLQEVSVYMNPMDSSEVCPHNQ